METEWVSFTVWRWSNAETAIPLEADTFGVDAVWMVSKLHWFLKTTLSFELRGPRQFIQSFLEKKLVDGSCKKIEVKQSLRHRLARKLA